MAEDVVGDKRPSRYGLPLPEVCHLELDAASVRIQGKDVFIIGDVHGCYDELCELMDKARSVQDDIIFIFVGDLVNRGPNCKEVVQLLRKQTTSCFSVRGNHEETTLREHARLSKDPDYPLPETYSYIRDFDADDIEYLQQLPYTISIPSLNVLVVHAGLEPNVALEAQCLTTMTHMRSLIPSEDGGRPRPTNKIDIGVPWGSMWPGPEHVYFGHDRRRGLQKFQFATGLDTGCAHEGHMTGQFVTGRGQILSVQSKMTRRLMIDHN